MFGKWRETKRIRQAEAEIEQISEALVPENAIRVIAVCVPGTKHGIVSGELVFGLDIVSVAPVAIRPVALENMSCTLMWAGMPTAVKLTDRDLAVKTQFLGLGEAHREVLSAAISWFRTETPPDRAAVSLAISGTLKIHAPWRAEYKTARFDSTIFVQVRE